MTVHPMLFATPLVEKLLSGDKRQTRRPLDRLNDGRRKFGKITEFGPSDTNGYDWTFRDKALRWHDLCDERLRAAIPYKPGDLIYVRETARWSDIEGWRFVADGTPLSELGHAALRFYQRDTCPSLHLPKMASRMTLKVTEVDLEPVQQITDENARQEGIQRHKDGWLPSSNWKGGDPIESPREAFRMLWDSIYAPGVLGWHSNPWILVLKFEVIMQNFADFLDLQDDGTVVHS